MAKNYKQELISRLMHECESSSTLNSKRVKFIHRYVKKYVEGMIKELSIAVVRQNNKRFPAQLAFSKSNARSNCGRYRINGKKGYIFDLFSKYMNLTLVNEVLKGVIGYYTRVTINPLYEQLIKECITPPPMIKQNNPNKKVKVDIDACNDYVEDLMVKLNDPKVRGSLRNKLLKNKNQILYFLQAVNERNENDEHFLTEQWVTKETGREYALGNINLQTCSKEVRHAVLGKCWRYDFKACSFAVMLGWAKQLRKPGDELLCEAIEDYIKHRDQMREQVSRETGIPLPAVKQIFTALGFGARVVNSPFVAIRGCIAQYTNAPNTQQSFNKLKKNVIFRYIREELDMVNDIILKYMCDPSKIEQFNDGIRDYKKFVKDRSIDANNKSIKLKNRQKLAFIYQASESIIMQQFIDFIKDACGLEPMITVHDCLYYKHPIPNECWHSALYDLREVFEDLMIEETQIWPIAQPYKFKQRYSYPSDQELKAHHERIRQETQRAREYMADKYKKVEYSQQQLDEIYERKRRQQWEEDMLKYAKLTKSDLIH